MMDNLAWDGAEEYYTTPNEVAYVANLLLILILLLLSDSAGFLGSVSGADPLVPLILCIYAFLHLFIN